MTGADRFQYFLDETGRKLTGTGNVIKALVSVSGIVPQEQVEKRIHNNEALKVLGSTYPSGNFYSPVLTWKRHARPGPLLSFHESNNPETLINDLLNEDRSFEENSPVHLHVIYEKNKSTHFLFSVNHALIDFTGMELLLKSLSESQFRMTIEKKPEIKFSFVKRFIHTVQATFFVASKSGWDIRRLKKSGQPFIQNYNYSYIPFSKNTEDKLQELHSGLAGYLALVIQSLDEMKDLFEKQGVPYFVPIPLNRRMKADEHVLLSNRMSFLFFRVEPDQASDIPLLRQHIVKKMLDQAKRGMPEKFSSLMNIFSFLPASIYKAFLNLPSKGETSTFAFSLLRSTFPENGIFMGHPVTNCVHYPPLLSPPGLNIVFLEERDGLKIITSFDKSRISRENVLILLDKIKSKLTIHV